MSFTSPITSTAAGAAPSTPAASDPATAAAAAAGGCCWPCSPAAAGAAASAPPSAAGAAVPAAARSAASSEEDAPLAAAAGFLWPWMWTETLRRVAGQRMASCGGRGGHGGVRLGATVRAEGRHQPAAAAHAALLSVGQGF